MTFRIAISISQDHDDDFVSCLVIVIIPGNHSSTATTTPLGPQRQHTNAARVKEPNSDPLHYRYPQNVIFRITTSISQDHDDNFFPALQWVL